MRTCKPKALRAAVVLVCALLLAPFTVFAAQLRPQPYDAAAAVEAARQLRAEVEANAHATPSPPTCNECSDLGALAQYLVESLMSVGPETAVDSEVIEALAVMSDSGAMVQSALLRLGDRAVPTLVRVAKGAEGPYQLYRKGTMDALEQMLEGVGISRPLSPESLESIRSLAAESLDDRSLTEFEIGSAACLAIATRDPGLRASASRLLDAGELQRRGLSPLRQKWTQQAIADALRKFPLK